MTQRAVGLGPGDILSVSAASRALGLRESDAAAWLRDRDLVRRVAGRERVIWGDVLAEIRRGETAPAPSPARGRLRRAALE